MLRRTCDSHIFESTIPLFVWFVCHRSTVWLGSSVVRVLAQYARGPGFECLSGHLLLSSPVTFSGQCVSMFGLRAAKGTVSSVPAWFREDSGTSLIKQEEVVTGRPCGYIAQWSECSQGMREVVGSSPGRAMCFCPPLWHTYDITSLALTWLKHRCRDFVLHEMQFTPVFSPLTHAWVAFSCS